MDFDTEIFPHPPSSQKNHSYHLVEPSPWPFVGALSGFCIALGTVLYMHMHNFVLMGAGFFLLLFTMFGWWHDVIHEGNDHHTEIVQRGLRIGVALFITSEIMFFVAFFWAFFDASLFPKIEIGSTWPPKGVHILDPFKLPYLNTLILLLSGTSLTWSHQALLEGHKSDLLKALIITIVLGTLFLCIQAYEYHHASFAFNGGIYSSTFYMATGFHGFHVFVGVVFLTVCLYRAYLGHFSPKKATSLSSHHVGFEAAAWYWHFVDVIWLFLFVSIYWWGSGKN